MYHSHLLNNLKANVILVLLLLPRFCEVVQELELKLKLTLDHLSASVELQGSLGLVYDTILRSRCNR